MSGSLRRQNIEKNCVCVCVYSEFVSTAIVFKTGIERKASKIKWVPISILKDNN